MVGRLIARAARPGHVPLIGIAGAQGSGKTTLARAAADAFGAAALSLDDAYLTRAERTAMARSVHPLFVVRGPPGTHDLGLLEHAITALRAAGPGDATPLPAFDKRADDRRPPADGPVFAGAPEAVLIDGWCLGATPQPAAALAEPVNALEAGDDADGRWRRAANDRLGGDYAALFARFDAILFLRAPGFEVVLDWRCEQEAGLMGLAPGDLPAPEQARLARFVQHFERISRHMLSGGVRADLTVDLDRNRLPVSLR